MESSEANNLEDINGSLNDNIVLDDVGNNVDISQNEIYVKNAGEIWPEYADPSYIMPDEIEVRVSTISGVYAFPVSITKKLGDKPYFGGYRNKATGNIYHHSSTQTPTENKTVQKENNKLRTRNTQTYEYRTISVQPVREHGTQMQRIDVYIDNSKDVVISPKTYFSSTELLYLKKEKALVIQRIWRGYIARCKAEKFRTNIGHYEEETEKELSRTMTLNRELKLQEMKHRNNPKTNRDFATLFNELDTWRVSEIARIKTTSGPGEERRQALAALLEQETKALQHIEKLKHDAYKNIHAEKTEKMLDLMSQPHKWQLSDGDIAQVQTPATVRAKELLDLYRSLCKPLASVNDRLEILLNVKWTVKESLPPNSGHAQSSLFTKDLIDLVDREADLLNRGRPFHSMDSLRTRIANLFLQYIESPQFNPRICEFIHIPLPPPPPRLDKDKRR